MKDIPFLRNDVLVVWSTFLFILVAVPLGELANWDVEWKNNPGFFKEEVPGKQGGNRTFNAVETIALEKQGYTAEGSSSSEVFAVEGDRILSISVLLKWTDDYGSNDEFRLRLLLDGAELDSQSGLGGSLSLSVEGNGTARTGNFSVEITAADCPGMIGPLPVDRDGGNSWDLKVTIREEVPADG